MSFWRYGRGRHRETASAVQGNSADATGSGDAGANASGAGAGAGAGGTGTGADLIVWCPVCGNPHRGLGGAVCLNCLTLVRRAPFPLTTISSILNIGNSAPPPVAGGLDREEALPRDELPSIQDLIGWRLWRITLTGYLHSLSTPAVWLPGEPMRGTVGDRGGSGVYAFKKRTDAILAADGTPSAYAVGSVILWGDVVEHERGYRAERALIRSLDDVVWQPYPPWSSDIKAALAFLRERYGVDGE